MLIMLLVDVSCFMHIPHLPTCSKVFGAGCSQKTVAIDVKTGVVIYNQMGGTGWQPDVWWCYPLVNIYTLW